MFLTVIRIRRVSRLVVFGASRSRVVRSAESAIDGFEDISEALRIGVIAVNSEEGTRHVENK